MSECTSVDKISVGLVNSSGVIVCSECANAAAVRSKYSIPEDWGSAMTPWQTVKTGDKEYFVCEECGDSFRTGQ